MAATITAARLHRHGAPLRVEEVPVAPPGEGEVAVDLAFAGVNPVDRYVAAGRVASEGPLPRTLGGEAAGWLEGRPVLVTGGGLGATRDGVFATAVTAPAGSVVPLAPEQDLQEASCVGVAGVTAWNVVTRTAGVGAGDRVLVLGAGGGVGLPVVSLASSLGARVWGQVRRQDKVGPVRAAGAEEVLVTGPEGLGAARALDPTVVVDPLGGPWTGAALEVLADRGRIAVFGTSAGAEVGLDLQSLYRRGQRIVGYGGLALSDEERREGLRGALGALARGELRIPVSRVLPLAQVNAALEELASGSVVGKLVLDLSGG